MFRRATAGLASAVLATTLLTACSGSSAVPDDCVPEHEFETLRDGVLKVSTYSLPPFANVEGRDETREGVAFTVGGTMVGVDGDILADFAAHECLEIEVHSSSAAVVLPTVQTGGADVGAGNWYRTTERAAILSLTDPIYVDPVAIISPDGISNFDDLQGLRVGSVVGYQYVSDLQVLFGDDVVLFNTPLTMFRALEDGDIDAVIDTVGVGREFTRENDLVVEPAEPADGVSASVEPGQSAFVVQQGRDDLLEALNATIARLRESGRLAEILQEHGLDPATADPGEPRLIDG